MRTQYLTLCNNGFTLIEVMIALVILSIGLIALASLQISSIKGNNFSKRMTTAISIADEKMELIKNTPYLNIQSESPIQITMNNMNFTREVTVNGNNPLPNTRTINVIVRWIDGTKTYTIPISTIISQ